MSENLNLYECEELIRIVEAQAAKNDGELSDEDLQTIVEAQTRSREQFEKLINYIKYLNGVASLAKAETDRLRARKQTAENRINGIKKWILPYVQSHGPLTVGTHRVSTRNSTGVMLADGFNNPEYGETIETFKPDKKLIKECIERGVDVPGAVLEKRVNVQIR